jgi:probable rRNA maturation factor
MVEVHNESDFPIDPAEFSDLVEFVLTKAGIDARAETTIILVDLDTMADLHKRWLGEAGPTDVMSFPIDEIKPGMDLTNLAHPVLGDIVLCPQFAKRQAQTQGHSLAEELLLLTVHSVLHLLGFDHQDPQARQEMFALQRQYLLEFLATR